MAPDGGAGAPRGPGESLARAAVAGAVVAGALALLTGTLVSGVAAYFARRVVTPERVKPDDVQVLSVGPGTVTLVAQVETTAPGCYGLRLGRGAGHARLGEVVARDERAGTVTRRLLQLDRGDLVPGPARWVSSFYVGDPTTALGLPHEDVRVTSDVGDLPTWFVPVSVEGRARDVWAVLVHGRGASREECLRAIPLLHRLGMSVLVPSYRNDPDAPLTHGGRSHLGDTEWRDVEATVIHALEAGAREVVLVGWSMGGAVVLQAVSRSWTADRVRALVLDGPVIDWRVVLEHQARVNRLPAQVGRLGLGMLAHPTARRLVGIDGPVDLDRLDWVSRAVELRLPVLLIHSDDDEFVPAGPSRALAQARPDLVTYLSVPGARHTTEWNVDPASWEREVARFLLGHL